MNLRGRLSALSDLSAWSRDSKTTHPIYLAATLATVPSIPIESLSLLIGIDRFMSECRAITNLIGNGVATVVISRWEGELTREQLNECLQK